MISPLFFLSSSLKISCSHSLQHSCHQTCQLSTLEAGIQNLLNSVFQTTLCPVTRLWLVNKVTFYYDIYKQYNIKKFKLVIGITLKCFLSVLPRCTSQIMKAYRIKFTGHKNPLGITGHLQGAFVPSSRFSAGIVLWLKHRGC